MRDGGEEEERREGGYDGAGGEGFCGVEATAFGGVRPDFEGGWRRHALLLMSCEAFEIIEFWLRVRRFLMLFCEMMLIWGWKSSRLR